MKMLIVSHTPHYRRKGVPVGWGPTVREIDHLALIFDEIIHIAPLHSGSAPENTLAYESSNIRLVPVPPSGGDRLHEKLLALVRAAGYLRNIRSELSRVELVHVRCPANIGLVAILLLTFTGSPRFRWIKYAGNWQPQGPEPWSYSLQRWWLKRGLQGGVVTVNGRWEGQPGHVRPFRNPCLTRGEIAEARETAGKKQWEDPVRLIFVGRVEGPKGIGRALEIVARLSEQRIRVSFDVIGDGPERGRFERLAAELGISEFTKFHGWVPRPSMGSFYARAHILIHPSTSSEGWPKVLSEAMAYGVVPVAGAISSIPQIIAETGAGVSPPAEDVDAFVHAVSHYAANPSAWKSASFAARSSAPLFTYDQYLCEVRTLFEEVWDVVLPTAE